MTFINFIAAAGGGGPTPPGAGDYSLIDTISATAKPFVDAGPIVISRDGSTVFAVGDDGAALGLWVWRWDGSSAWPNLQVIALGTPGDYTAAVQKTAMTLACSEDGSRVVLGMPDAVSADGRVYVFDETSSDTWTQYQRIAPPSGGHAGRYGSDVDITNDGLRIVVGEPSYSPTGYGQGHVYLDSGSSFALEATLADNSGRFSGAFGAGVCLSGDGAVAVLGSPLGLSAGFRGLGWIQSHARSGTTWSFEAIAYPSDDVYNILSDSFSRGGQSMCMDESGENILTADAGGVGDDSVHYTRSGGSLVLQSLVDGFGGTGVSSAPAMAMAGDASFAVLGDYGYDGAKGRVRRWSGPAWALSSNIDATSPTANQQHGRGVGISRDGSIVVWSESPNSGNSGASLADRCYLKVF